MAFLNEPTPPRGIAQDLHPGIRRIVAENPGPMTYHGTNTWLIDAPDGVLVIDPGPDDASHVAAILAQAGRPITRIFLTHTHPDHVGAAPALSAASGAPIAGFGTPWFRGFTPDIPLADGDELDGLTVLHTPGHASDHLCFAMGEGLLFSGDHVMSWNTSIVSPPDGDMAAYMASLRLLLARDDQIYFCGHGPKLENPQPLVRAMLTHRVGRENAVLGALTDTPKTPATLVDALYTELDPSIKPAAARSVLAHLLKLAGEGRAQAAAEGWVAAT